MDFNKRKDDINTYIFKSYIKKCTGTAVSKIS